MSTLNFPSRDQVRELNGAHHRRGGHGDIIDLHRRRSGFRVAVKPDEDRSHLNEVADADDHLGLRREPLTVDERAVGAPKVLDEQRITQDAASHADARPTLRQEGHRRLRRVPW